MFLSSICKFIFLLFNIYKLNVFTETISLLMYVGFMASEIVND